MANYTIRFSYRGYNEAYVQADNEEDAKEQYRDGNCDYGDASEDDYEIDEVICEDEPEEESRPQPMPLSTLSNGERARLKTTEE